MNFKYFLPISVIVILSILLLYNIFQLDFENLGDSSYTGIISNITIIAAMILLIVQIRKNEKEKNN